VTETAPPEPGDRPDGAPPATAGRIVPANTDRPLPPGGFDPRSAGDHLEEADPRPRPAVEALLEGLGRAGPKLLATLYAALARLLGG
jgi:hypothetical protein